MTVKYEDLDEAQKEHYAKLVFEADVAYLKSIKDSVEDPQRLENVISNIDRMVKTFELRTNTRTWFVTGASETKEWREVPQNIYVCPVFGVNVVYTYRKTDETIMEGS